MSDIKVPFMPVSSFDVADIFDNFSDASPEINELKEVTLNQSFPEEKKKKSDSITLILIGMGMEKYLKLFEDSAVTLDTFLKLDENDLEEIGITDPEDRKRICESLSVHKSEKNEFSIPENHAEDLRIIQNLFSRLEILKAYSYYVNLQMLKNKLKDYEISDEESACFYLKSFTESALIQSQLLCQAIYDEQNMDGLLNVVYKDSDMSKILAEKFHKKRKKKFVLKIMAVVGFFSLFILAKKYFIKKW